jgi:hypothetical protein
MSSSRLRSSSGARSQRQGCGSDADCSSGVAVTTSTCACRARVAARAAATCADGCLEDADCASGTCGARGLCVPTRCLKAASSPRLASCLTAAGRALPCGVGERCALACRSPPWSSAATSRSCSARPSQLACRPCSPTRSSTRSAFPATCSAHRVLRSRPPCRACRTQPRAQRAHAGCYGSARACPLHLVRWELNSVVAVVMLLLYVLWLVHDLLLADWQRPASAPLRCSGCIQDVVCAQLSSVQAALGAPA